MPAVSYASRARSAVFAPLGDPGRAARVERRLAEAIRSGILADGERLPSEADLASMLGVATVTAREALVALRSQGLVTTLRGRGGGSFVNRPKNPPDDALVARLSDMSRVELRDWATVYRVNLAGCAELAAERSGDHDAASLQELLLTEDVVDVARWRHTDAELTLSIAALTHSARMTRHVIALEADFGALLRLPLVDREFRTGAAVRHASLVAGIATRDPLAARTVAQQHVDQALEHLVERQAQVRS